MEQSGPILNLIEGDELFIKCRSYQDMTFYTILDKPVSYVFVLKK